MIAAIELRKTYHMGAVDVEVLKGIDLSVPAGEFVSIMGPSGAGKSTLLHLLGALDHPTAGTVVYGTEDVFSLPRKRLPMFRNRNIGFVFQFHYLLQEFTARENVRLSGLVGNRTDPAEFEQRVETILRDVGLGDRMEHRPGQLSGGERQRVAIARALVTEPRVVFADEPTGNLDTKTGQEVFNLLHRLNRDRGVTMVMVTHNESLAIQTDRIVRMKDGVLE